MASSCKTTLHFRFRNKKLICSTIVVASNLERLYDKTSDLGLDYKTGC